MTSVTAEKAETIRQYVLDCSIRRLTVTETTEYLKQVAGISIDPRTVKRYRARIKESAQTWVAKLARSKRAEFIAEYQERCEEIRKCQRELWNIVYDARTGQRVKVEAISQIIGCTSRLVELHDAIPLMNAIRDWGCGFNHDHDRVKTGEVEEVDVTDKTSFWSAALPTNDRDTMDRDRNPVSV